MTYNQLEEEMRQAAARRKSAVGENGLYTESGRKTPKVGDSGRGPNPSSGGSFGGGGSSSVSAALPTYNSNSFASAGARGVSGNAESSDLAGGSSSSSRFARGRAGATGGSGVQGGGAGAGGSGQYGAGGAMSDLARASRMSKRAAEAGGAAQKNAAAREAFGEGGGGDEGAVIDPNTGAVNSDRFAPSVNQPLNLGNAFAADDSKKP